MSSLPAVWVVVVFLLPIAAVLALWGSVAWICRRDCCGGPSDWPRRLLARALRLLPEDRREWGAASGWRLFPALAIRGGLRPGRSVPSHVRQLAACVP